jgi:hypothetical protein
MISSQCAGVKPVDQLVTTPVAQRYSGDFATYSRAAIDARRAGKMIA